MRGRAYLIGFTAQIQEGVSSSDRSPSAIPDLTQSQVLGCLGLVGGGVV